MSALLRVVVWRNPSGVRLPCQDGTRLCLQEADDVDGVDVRLVFGLFREREFALVTLLGQFINPVFASGVARIAASSSANVTGIIRPTGSSS
jgi:hypothetical protein